MPCKTIREKTDTRKNSFAVREQWAAGTNFVRKCESWSLPHFKEEALKGLAAKRYAPGRKEMEKGIEAKENYKRTVNERTKGKKKITTRWKPVHFGLKNKQEWRTTDHNGSTDVSTTPLLGVFDTNHQGCGSGLDPDSIRSVDPDSEGQKLPTKVENFFVKVHVLKCWMASLESWRLLL
jgi:hypothetical protein